MSYKLLSAILKSTWFIQPDYVESHMPIIANLLSKGSVTGNVSKDAKLLEDDNVQPYGIVNGRIVNLQGSLRKGVDYSTVPVGSIAVIPVKGPLMKEDEDDCGYFTAGTATLARRIQEADVHNNISGIILHFDTPGGTIDGIQAFADVIKGTEKPIVGFVDGLCASAGVFAASSCDYMVAQNITAEIGSIGVMMSFIDAQPYYEQLGFKFHEIYSTLSPDKNRDFLEAKKGNYEPIQKDGLDPYAQIFRNQVKTNRPQVNEESMTGKIYLAEEALKRGLIDEIGGIQIAANKVNELAKAKAEASINNQPKTKMKEFPKLQALLGLDTALEATDEGSYLTEANLQAIEDRLALAETNATELETARTDLATTQASLTTVQEELTERDQTIASLKKKPAAAPASAKTTTDKPTSEEAEDIITICEEEDTAAAAAKLKEMGF